MSLFATPFLDRPAVGLMLAVLRPAARVAVRSAVALAAVGLATGPLGRGLRRGR
ncbi:hypothetical protein [Alienimonas californiensis]|uniref:Uncharacterized protein n=1 Tax=Alienimonas californiensis TaxID=2527989 RepID=A0A517PAY5_9PLAN|nr:hypothetical protein [Alienimonas californiensis]QDT16545.1 hypothetical protein CA12_26510 [Alienimonas californiensis]